MVNFITGYVAYALVVWQSFAIGEIINLVFGFAAIIILAHILMLTKDGFHKSLRFFLYAFVAYAVIKIIRILGSALGFIDHLQVKMLIMLFNFIFLGLILIGLKSLLKTIKSVCDKKVKKK